MVDDHDVEDDLRHPERIREGRSCLRPFEESKHPINAENSIHPQHHRTWNLVNYIWKIINSFTRATLSNICHYYDPLTQSIQGIEPKVCQSIILSGPEVDLFVAGDTSVEEGKVSWEHTYHVQHKGKSPEIEICFVETFKCM